LKVKPNRTRKDTTKSIEGLNSGNRDKAERQKFEERGSANENGKRDIL
jgi:hypothetical protein